MLVHDMPQREVFFPSLSASVFIPSIYQHLSRLMPGFLASRSLLMSSKTLDVFQIVSQKALVCIQVARGHFVWGGFPRDGYYD